MLELTVLSTLTFNKGGGWINLGMEGPINEGIFHLFSGRTGPLFRLTPDLDDGDDLPLATPDATAR